MQIAAHVVGRQCIMLAPHDHGHEAYLTVPDPTEIIFEVSSSQYYGLTEVAVSAHCTFKIIVECHATIVPAAGTDETTLVQLGELAPGPCVL